MLGILLVIDLLAISLAVYSLRRQREFLREAVLIGFVLWAAGIMAATEVLSLFHAIGFWEILIFWIMVLALCSYFISKQWGSLSIKEFFHPPQGLNGPNASGHWPFLEKVFFNRIVFLSFCLGIIALLAPPNTYDAMSYHMSRVMHWIQNGCVAYYPTNIILQLIYPTFAEYVILHFQVLSGGDHWANLVQWLAMCGSLIGVSLIAKELGAAKRGQILSALTAVTIPMGILQATSTQTDYVDTLWLCCIIYFFFRWRKSLGWGYALLVGLSLGLDLATKGAALIYAAPFLGWMAVEAVRRLNIKKYLLMGGMVLGVAVLLYSGILYRNTVFFHGHVTNFSSVHDSLFNERFCWEGFLSNILRNAGLHLSTPWVSVNTAIEKGIYGLASFLHLDLNNKDWTFTGYRFSVISFRSDEDMTGNLLHFILFGVVLLLFAITSRFRSRDAGFYLTACFLGWMAFSALLKWQPFHSRFHLGMFVIFTPMAGVVMERIKIRWIVSGAMGALFLSAWIIILLNMSKQMCSSLTVLNPANRPGLYFIRGANAQETFLEHQLIGEAIHKMGCRNIGLIMGQYDIEYYLWVALNPSASRSMRIESILVDNASAALKYPLGDFVPDVIIAFDEDRPWINWGNNIYQEAWHNQIERKKISILIKSQ